MPAAAANDDRRTRSSCSGCARRAHQLDAIVASTNNAAWVTDLDNADDSGFVSSTTPAAVSAYPNLTVPAGFARGALPMGMSFFGARFSEPTLIALGYAFEHASQVRRPPMYLPTLWPPPLALSGKVLAQRSLQQHFP